MYSYIFRLYTELSSGHDNIHTSYFPTHTNATESLRLFNVKPKHIATPVIINKLFNIIGFVKGLS